jgi:hypothetical protein
MVYGKKGDCSDTLVSCSVEHYWAILASPQAEDKESGVRPQFPLIARGKISERVVCFTEETRGIIIEPDVNLNDKVGQKTGFVSCFSKGVWSIIASSQPVDEEQDAPASDEVKSTFPLIAWNKHSKLVVRFVKENSGAVLVNSDGSNGNGEEEDNLKSCFDEKYWQIINANKNKPVKEFEIEKCKCGKEVPVEFMKKDKDGLQMCPECRISQLSSINAVYESIIMYFNNKL